MLWLWQPMSAVVWSVANPAGQALLWSLFGFGWLYLVASTFVTNHFDLFGLRQAWLFMRGEDYRPVPFTRTWMYRYSRHPMMAGILIGLWAIPTMTAAHLAFALGMTLYIAIGMRFEERALTRHFGDTYRQYSREVGRFFPRLR